MADELVKNGQPTKLARVSSGGSGFNPLAFRRRFASFGSVRRTLDDVEDNRGPLALTPLHEPEKSLVELIFVHGLRGGSYKTWTYDEDPETFWPARWLPSESGFEHVRIHTFGYNSDWSERGTSTLSVHDFGLSLLESIRNARHFRHNTKNPIILVGHSMGGLVIKKAFNLAKIEPENALLKSRFHTLIFLATPHKGADDAQLLNKILRTSLTHSTKPYVTDLEPHSGTLQEINDTFRKMCQKTEVWSFYEGQPTNLGISNEPVVDKDSAIIGLERERQQVLNADHRHVCKFRNRNDANYRTIVDVLESTVEQIINASMTLTEDVGASEQYELEVVANLLGALGVDDELANLEPKAIEGSCQWLPRMDSFREWVDTPLHAEPNGYHITKDPSHVPRRFFWLTGGPGCGKSVTADFISRELAVKNPCSFYVFKSGDKTERDVGRMLSSLAFQMAKEDSSIRECLMRMHNEGDLLEGITDFRIIWRQLFQKRILRKNPSQTHYWVIDALDECRYFPDVLILLSKIGPDYPLKILVTSQMKTDLKSAFKDLSAIHEEISAELVSHDIRLFVQANVDRLHVNEQTAANEWVETLVEKANGSFLWTELVVKELSNVWGVNAMSQTLEEVPKEMNKLYQRIIEQISQARPKELIKAILRWAVCSIRSLTVLELSEALSQDLNDSFQRIEDFIESTCSQLIHVVRGKVQLRHETARIFLLDSRLKSELAVDRAQGHARIAGQCLRYLSDDDTKRAKGTRRRGASYMERPMLDYACAHFSDHIIRSRADPSTIKDVEQFLNTSVLKWIEYHAKRQDLSPVTRAAKNLRRFVDQLAAMGIYNEASDIEAWAIDLVRVVTMFGHQLLREPGSIYFIVPPLCPRKSMIFQKHGDSGRVLQITGLSLPVWPERLASYSHEPDYTRVVACSDKRYAVGSRKKEGRSSEIVVYYPTTCQVATRFSFDDYVRCLKFATVGDLIAAGGGRTVCVWDVHTGAKLWCRDLDQAPMEFAFDEADQFLYVATRSKDLLSLSTADGTEDVDSAFSWSDAGVSLQQRSVWPIHVYISASLGILAAVYRREALQLWDFMDRRFIGAIDTNTSVEAVAFNHYLELIAVASRDGFITTYNPVTLEQIHSVEAYASMLASSTDGFTLLAGNNDGDIHIIDFESLHVLHTIQPDDQEVTDMAFMTDNQRFVVSRVTRHNVWEPAVLICKKDSEDGSENQGFQAARPVVNARLTSNRIAHTEFFISAMIAHHEREAVFVGKENGTVAVYSTATGLYSHTLHRHAAEVHQLHWNSGRNLLVSADIAGRVLVHKVVSTSTGSAKDEWESTQILDRRINDAIHQIIVSEDGSLLLISTPSKDTLWELDSDSLVASFANISRSSHQKWIADPTKEHILIKIGHHHARTLNLDNIVNRKDFGRSGLEPMKVFSDSGIHNKSGLGTHFIHLENDVWAACNGDTYAQPFVWPRSYPDDGEERPLPPRHYAAAATVTKCLIGVYRDHLVFMNNDDWVCTMPLDEEQDWSYKKHFFIPQDWPSGDRRLITLITPRGEILVAKEDEVAVIKRGLQLSRVDQNNSPIENRLALERSIT